MLCRNIRNTSSVCSSKNQVLYITFFTNIEGFYYLNKKYTDLLNIYNKVIWSFCPTTSWTNDYQYFISWKKSRNISFLIECIFPGWHVASSTIRLQGVLFIFRDNFLVWSVVNGNCPKNLWDKVFKNGPSKICGRQPLKKLKGYEGICLSRPYPFKFFRGCLPQMLLSPIDSWMLGPISCVLSPMKAFFKMTFLEIFFDDIISRK